MDIPYARTVLDEDHYDLEEVKARIIEYLAVRKLLAERSEPVDQAEEEVQKIEGMGAILCFAGPPGVGKTSLGQSIARALGRRFTRMSLGGMRDEAEIRGHRRTYIGAMPGRIIQAIKRAGTRNPVFMLDEVDKVGNDWRGDPSSALLEVLDPAQNHAFRDHYLDVDFDLSDVMFITTANQVETIPAPLRDRMEIIQLDGYTEYEKLHIAKRYLVPRQLKANGLRDDEMDFSEEAIQKIIQHYTREAGVRNLERNIGAVCRKGAVNIAEGREGYIHVTEDVVRSYLKKERFESELSEAIDMPGIATGLAVTPVGGDILFIEATLMNGEGRLTLTGQLGDVMKESAQIAHSYVRSKVKSLDLDLSLFKSADIHVHVPAGAIPKDGPSAGLAMVMAVISLCSGRPVYSDVGLTGEVTLRGRVLPVGGIKMKLLAAHRAGLKTVILPKRNEKDLEELPEEVRDDLNIVLVETIEEALEKALSFEKQEMDLPLAVNY
jgi:ATP-dependent Lon protease